MLLDLNLIVMKYLTKKIVQYFVAGQIRYTGTTIGGIKQGKHIEYDSYGSIVYVANYKNGTYHGKVIKYGRSEETFVNGLLHGMQVYRNVIHTKSYCANYIYGNIHGRVISRDGHRVGLEHTNYGIKIGYGIEWYKEKIVSIVYFDFDGNRHDLNESLYISGIYNHGVFVRRFTGEELQRKKDGLNAKYSYEEIKSVCDKYNL